jgi:hypothetical protein
VGGFKKKMKRSWRFFRGQKNVSTPGDGFD